MSFVKYRKIYFIISGALVIASIASLFIFGLKPGIEFTGGSILELEFESQRPSHQEIREVLAPFNLQETIQSTGEKGVIIKMRHISEDEYLRVVEAIDGKAKIIKERTGFQAIGPTIGRELKQKTRVVMVLSLIAILLYVAFAFRRVSYPVKSWQYGIAAIVALFHDVLIPLGVFSVLGSFYNIQITIPIVTALLTIFGYSINDTVVVFDRIRENLLKRVDPSFEVVVDKSLKQTLGRSINTSFTTLIVLFAIFFFGGETLKNFSLALIIGIIAGTYSSIFLASQLLVSWYRSKHKVVS
ncbi:MAG TPA: protein translocase subunit SecF [Candidatus Parcubacteria bacterium]|nr:protein translocase subunit SecF [Candidatus Parcubacteria bacterium]